MGTPMENELVIDVKGVVDDVAQTRQPGEDLDEAILRATKARYPEQSLAVFNAIRALLDMQVARSKASPEEALQHLGGPIVLRTSSEPRTSRSLGLRLGGGPSVSRSVSFVTTTRSSKDMSQAERDEIARVLEDAAHRLESSDPAETPIPAPPEPIGPTIDQVEAAGKPRSLWGRLRDRLG
jgi:hypothetical protein